MRLHSRIALWLCLAFAIVAAAPAFAQGWAAPVNISAGDTALQPQIAVNGSGVVTAVWVAGFPGPSAIRASRYSGGSWSAPATLSGPAASALFPDVAVDGSGAATAVWLDLDGTDLVVRSARYSSEGWSAPVTLSAAGADAFDPHVAVHSGGDVTVSRRKAAPDR